MENIDLSEYDKKVLESKVKKCLNCNVATDSNDSKELYCSQCGAPVLNKCSSYNCQEILDEKAKYCKYCGSESIFYNYGLLNNPPQKSFSNTDDLPF